MTLFFESLTETDPVVTAAAQAFVECETAIGQSVDGKATMLSCYDPSGMTRVATICHWGRSGSVLLASYLDNHPDVITLPNQTSEHLYQCYRQYPGLSVWEKLIVYPFYSVSKRGNAGDFFLKNNPDGDYAIEREDYFAAVVALARLYQHVSATTISSRVWFFRLAHLAYAGGLGKCARDPSPVMIAAQHWFSEDLSRLLSEDFPDAQFIHSIRDPISGFDSWLERHFTWQFRDSPIQFQKYSSPSFDAYANLLAWDSAHRVAVTSSRAVRFEDLHLKPLETMQRLSAWLKVSDERSLTESTLNGRPYVVTAGGVSWVGANPKNARRRSSNLNKFDQWVLFSLLRSNFELWEYPEPRAFRWRAIRAGVLLAGLLIPTKMELRNARLNAVVQARPAMNVGRRGFALALPVSLIKRRIRFAALIATQAVLRGFRKRVPIPLI